MPKQSILLTALICLLTGILSTGFAQTTTYTVDFGDASELTIKGTSTLHDWSIDCQKIGGEPEILTDAFKDGGVIKDFYFYADVASMESGRGAIMNKKTVILLKAYSDFHTSQSYRLTLCAMPFGEEKASSPPHSQVPRSGTRG